MNDDLVLETVRQNEDILRKACMQLGRENVRDIIHRENQTRYAGRSYEEEPRKGSRKRYGSASNRPGRQVS